MQSNFIYAAIALPILLMYLLVFLRTIERRKISPELPNRGGSLQNIRDAALITVALDMAEIVQSIVPLLENRLPTLAFAIASLLFFLHLSVFLLVASRWSFISHAYEMPGRPTFTRRLLDLYLTLSLLMTNATTIVIVVQNMGSSF